MAPNTEVPNSTNLYFLMLFTFILANISLTFQENIGMYHQNEITKPSCTLRGFDVFNLTKSIWTLQRRNEDCLGWKTNRKVNCTLSVAFCRPVSCNNIVSTGFCDHTFNATGNKSNTFYAVGYSKPNPFEISKDPESGVFQVLMDGQIFNKTDGSICNLKTTIYFFCDRSVNWPLPSSSNSSSIPSSALEYSSYDGGACMYTLRLKYAGACPTLQPAVVTPSGVSPGSILLIIFFVCLSLYFLVGMMCNYLRGYRGKDVVPHVEFWLDLPVAAADGCLFVVGGCKAESGSGYDSI